MNKTKQQKQAHTPGPWVVYNLPSDDYEGGGLAVGPADTREKKKDFSLSNSGFHVCIMAGHHDDEANARLLAAAPDLLGALRSVMASVPFASYRGDGELEECEMMVRSAIRKATGDE